MSSTSLIKPVPKSISVLLAYLSPFALSTAVASVGLIIAASFLLFSRRKQSSKPVKQQDEECVYVDQIWIYPIKSCKGIRLQKATVAKTGFQYDREFMLIDQNNKFTSQRVHPKMALIQTEIDEEDSQLMLWFGGRSLKVSLRRDESLPILKVSVWGEICDGIDVGGYEAVQFFARVVGIPNMRLVRMANNFNRPTDPAFAPKGQTSFSDGYPFLLLSNESMADLNSRSKEKYHIENFRPNIVIKGCKHGFREDAWLDIEFVSPSSSSNTKQTSSSSSSSSSPAIKMKVAKPCSRCKIPSVDFTTGVIDEENKVTKLLKTFRTGQLAGFEDESWAKEVFVGQNLDHEAKAGGVISVGDKLKVLSFRK